MRKKNFLVTGGTGFIGSNISKLLIKKNYNVKIFDNNSRGNLNKIKNFRRKIKFIKGDVRNQKLLNRATKNIDAVIVVTNRFLTAEIVNDCINRNKNVFAENLDRIPNKSEMEDIWFTADFKVNYERLNSINDQKKLEKLNIFLKYVCERISQKNPLINQFRSIILEKLNNNKEADQLKKLSQISLANSEYWKKRFISLNIN